MVIEKLNLCNYRNYETLDLNVDSKTNILYGDNAQGKTNILEAIYICSTTKSHRGGKDKEVIKFGCDDAHIKIYINKKNKEYRIDIHLKKNKSKGIAINGIPIKKASELLKKELENIQFGNGNEIGVIRNLDGVFYTEQDNLSEILSKHITSPVRFDKAIQLMKSQNVERFIEIGPGKTLTGFVKKDYPEAQLYNINNLESLEKFINE